MKGRLFIAGLAVLVAGTASRHLASSTGSDVPLGPAVGTANPKPRGWHGIGYVEPISELRKLTTRTGGVIKTVRFTVGNRVRKGDVIVELEDATLRAEAAAARCNLAMVAADAANVKDGVNPHHIRAVEQAVERLKEQVRFDQSELKRHGPLRARSTITEQAYDAVESQYRQSELRLGEMMAELDHLRNHVTQKNREWQEARVDHARACLELAEERMRETKLLAPFDGTILKILKREGEGVSFAQPEPVILFGDMSRLRVRSEFDERFARLLAQGQLAEISGRNLAGETFRGRVSYAEQVMGTKTLFTHSSSERKDLEVIEVLIDMEPSFRAPAGMRMDVTIMASDAPVARRPTR